MGHSNGYYVRGKTHTVCQDYVRCGSTPQGFAYTIVSDGCSSSPDTDVGARILTLVAEQYLQGFWGPGRGAVDFALIAFRALAIIQSLGLPRETLDATLLVGLETPEVISVYLMGDGVVAGRQRTGNLRQLEVAFARNAPYYASYLTDPALQDQFLAFPNNRRVATWTQTVGPNQYVTRDLSADYLTDYNKPVAEFRKDEFDLVALMTDGATSFHHCMEPISPITISQQVLSVRGVVGEFMVRRARRFLEHHCVAEGWYHDDDFGVGAIFVSEGPHE